MVLNQCSGSNLRLLVPACHGADGLAHLRHQVTQLLRVTSDGASLARAEQHSTRRLCAALKCNEGIVQELDGKRALLHDAIVL